MPSSIALSMLLLSFVSSSLAYLDGAREESCYDHAITHFPPFQQDPAPLISCSDPCAFQLDILGSVPDISTPDVLNPLIISSTPDADFVYQCNTTYMLQVRQAGINGFQGFLVQARNNTVNFEPGSSMYGEWVENSTYLYKPLYCRKSMNDAMDKLMPNSATQRMASDIESQSTVPLYWISPPASEDPPIISFWYSIVQQLSSGYYPEKGPVGIPHPSCTLTTTTTMPPNTISSTATIGFVDMSTTQQPPETTTADTPGVPTQLGFEELDATSCRTVTFTWEQPSAGEQNSVITMYRIEVNLASTGELVASSEVTTNYYTVTNQLQCCSDYTFRVAAATSAGYGPYIMYESTVRTLADLSNPVMVIVNVITDNTITVRWAEPPSVTAQHEEHDIYTVAVTHECLNGQTSGIETFEPQTVDFDANPSVAFVNLDTGVPYRVTLSAIVCGSSVSLYNEIWYTRPPSGIDAPTITGTARLPDIPTTARVEWTSTAADVVDVNVYSGESFDMNNLVETIEVGPTSSNNTEIKELNVCTPYWFRARAVTCGAEAFSEPFKLEIYDMTVFEFLFDLTDGSSCSDWIKVNTTEKIAAIENEMTNTLNSVACEYIHVGCYAGSTLACSDTTVNFSTSLVGHGPLRTSTVQAGCLIEWLGNNPYVVLPNTEVPIVLGDTTTFSLPTAQVINFPTYGIALIIVAILVVVIVVLVVVLSIVFARRKLVPKITVSLDQDCSQSHTSKMENARNDDHYTDLPGDAVLSAKEKKAKADNSSPPEWDISINFNPPGPNDYQ